MGLQLRWGFLTEKVRYLTSGRLSQGKRTVVHIYFQILQTLLNRKTMKKIFHTGDITGIGIGIPGPITEDGRVLKCANLGWGIFSVADELSRLTDVGNIKAGNDANVAALGEQWRGGGRGFDSIVMVTLGTGVGGGVIQNGRIITGANGAAGEIGHLKVNTGETCTCGCGGKGCLEQYSSATAIMRHARELVSETEEESYMRQFPKEKISRKRDI